MKGKSEAEVHKDLEGFDIKIDPFGKMETSFSIEKLNKFLDQNVQDKKLSQSPREEEE